MRKLWVYLAISLLIWSTGTLWAQQPTYTVGIVPQQSASRLAKLWIPILQALEKQTDFKLQFSTAKNIPTFEDRVFNQQYDFAYMNPYHYVVFSQKPGYRAFAREEGKTIKGILVTRKDAGVEAIEQLQGQKLAFPSPAAFAASVLPRASLTKSGIDFTPQYVSSHDSVYRAVAKGIFPAGGGILRTFNNLPEDVKADLRVFWTTAEFTPHAFAARPGIPAAHVAQLQQAMRNLLQSTEGKEVLQAVNFGKGLRFAEDRDWDDVRALNITLLDKYLK
jgi:phosphonate transport system substrate-binding protein